MGAIESLIYMIWRGIAIGVIISAPMGPVGILCVQRTLEKGRRTGFYTGVGAALSDLFYCLLTGFGLSFIEEFLNRNSNIIQLIGSVVLIGFGVYLFKSNPSKKLKKPVENDRIPAGKNILSGFLFTFSNPLIIFLIIGLFARFNFFMPEIKFYHYIIGFMAVIAGALLWWWVVTFFVDKVRAHFNLRSMWLINKIIGGIIFLFAIVGIITGVTGFVNAAVVKPFEVFKIGGPEQKSLSDTIILGPGGDTDIRFRVKNLHNKCGKSYSYVNISGKRETVEYPFWEIELGRGKSSEVIRVKTKDERINPIVSPPELQFSLYREKELSADRHFATGFNIFDGPNSYKLSLKNNVLIFSGGCRQYNEIFRVELEDEQIEWIKFGVEEGGAAEISDLIICHNSELEHYVPPCMAVEEEIKTIARKSDDPLIGIWGLWGYSFDDNYIKPGGDYIIGIIPDTSGEEFSNISRYKIIYLDGSKVGSDRWRKGMVKGYIEPSHFPEVYNLEWIDASGQKVKKEIKAIIDLPELRIQIPEYMSNATFRKM